MEEVIRYLLLLNHPENSDFFQVTQLLNQRILMLVYFIFLYGIVYVFIFCFFVYLLSIHPSLTIGICKNK